MTRILLTGKNSFIGRNYLKYSKYKVIEEISLFENRPEDIDFSRFDIIIHLVAIVHQSKKISENEYFRINRDLCLSVAQFAKKAGVKQFIFLSTAKVYGEFISGSNPWNEKSLCFPADYYSKSKYEAEVALRQMEDIDFTVSIIRTPVVYGVGVKANILSILRLVDKCPILPFAKVINKRCFTFAENLTAFIDRIIEKKANGIFIAMDENPISTTDLVNFVSRSLNKKILLVKLPDIFFKIGKFLIPKLFDRLYGSFELDNSATLKVLDFRPPYTTEQGIKSMVESYKNNKKLSG